MFNINALLNQCNITNENAINWIPWLFACHDIGKFARSFQKKLPFSDPALVPCSAKIVECEQHDSLGFYLWQQLLEKWYKGENEIIANTAHGNRNKFKTALNIWMSISTGHHGIPPNTKTAALAFDDDDITAACHYLEALYLLFPFTLPPEWATTAGKQQLRTCSWLFAGIMTIADWMGSDQTQFPFYTTPIPLKDYWPIACKNAARAISAMPQASEHRCYRGHQALFPFIHTLTPLQQRVTTLNITAPGPQLIILEDATGAGKTEAALILTHRLMSADKGKGLYVGLPTMATANAMYVRLAHAYRTLFTDDARPSLILAHGARQLSSLFKGSIWQPDAEVTNDYVSDDNSTLAEYHVWFADSRKKSLLAEVGVGTLDQLLMAVMPFRHQSLRLLGMHNKILLLDEVHAYDGYMIKLLEGLLGFNAAQGGSAIILSATDTAHFDARKITQRVCRWR